MASPRSTPVCGRIHEEARSYADPLPARLPSKQKSRRKTFRSIASPSARLARTLAIRPGVATEAGRPRRTLSRLHDTLPENSGATGRIDQSSAANSTRGARSHLVSATHPRFPRIPGTRAWSHAQAADDKQLSKTSLSAAELICATQRCLGQIGAG